MKIERTFEFISSEIIPISQHLALLCKMLEAAEEGDERITVESIELAEDNAA